jgi:glutathione S-transferase
VPALIHDGEVITELNQIVTYVCRAFDREDLLGITLQQQVTISRFRRKCAK